MSDQNTVNEPIPRMSPKRFGTRSVCADLCTVDCYTCCNKVEIHIFAITTVAAPTTTTTPTKIKGTTTAATTTTCSRMKGTADAESKVPAAENPDLTKFNVPPLQTGVGQNITRPRVLHQLPAISSSNILLTLPEIKQIEHSC